MATRSAFKHFLVSDYTQVEEDAFVLILLSAEYLAAKEKLGNKYVYPIIFNTTLGRFREWTGATFEFMPLTFPEAFPDGNPLEGITKIIGSPTEPPNPTEGTVWIKPTL